MSEEKKEDNNHFLSDTPIELSEQDLLNYKHYADKVRRVIQNNSNNQDPLTIGIYGKWGEGKTSFLNLVKNQIDNFKKENDNKGIVRFHFNPWRYGTDDEMLFAFFEGLAQSLFLEKESNLQKAGRYIKGFSRYLKAIKLSASIGLPLSNTDAKMTFDPSVIFETLGNDLKGEELSLESFKYIIDESLKKAKWKVVIFIDDVDRLDKSEIHTLLKIVKLNASFNNLIYLIPMDQEQVAKAIKHRFGDDIKDGYKFLEKIINIPIHLPKIEYSDLRVFFNRKLEEVYNSSEFDSDLLTQKGLEYEEITDNYFYDQFTTPREVIRVLNSFYIGLFSIGHETHLGDLFWIEYLKVIHPKLYLNIKKYNVKSLSLGLSIISYENILDTDEINSLSSTQYRILGLILPKEERTIFGDFANSNRNRTNTSNRINQPDHFDKYFSYHLMNKMVIGDFNLFKNKALLLIKDDSESLREEIEIILKDLIEKYGSRKTLYELESLIDLERETVNVLVLIQSLVLFRVYFSDQDPNIFALTSRKELIEKLALILNKLVEEKRQNISDFIFDLSSDFDYQELSYFTRKFKIEEIRSELESKILIKVKNFNENNEAFFKYPKNPMNKMIMSIWKNLEPKTFDEFIKNNLNSGEEVGLLIRNFPGYWNGEYFGSLTKDNYDFMKSLIDVDLVSKRVQQYCNIDPEKINMNKKNDKDNRTIKENIEEFVYHYSRDTRPSSFR